MAPSAASGTQKWAGTLPALNASPPRTPTTPAPTTAGGAEPRAAASSGYDGGSPDAVEEGDAGQQQDPEEGADEVGLERGLGGAGGATEAEQGVERDAGEEVAHGEHEQVAGAGRARGRRWWRRAGGRRSRSRGGPRPPRPRRGGGRAGSTTPATTRTAVVATSTAKVPSKAVVGSPAAASAATTEPTRDTAATARIRPWRSRGVKEPPSRQTRPPTKSSISGSMARGRMLIDVIGATRRRRRRPCGPRAR